jgi:hypothetical protein
LLDWSSPSLFSLSHLSLKWREKVREFKNLAGIPGPPK